MILPGVFSDATTEPCPRCLKLAWNEKIRVETIMPLPEHPARSRDENEPVCRDCESADTVQALNPSLSWEMARVAVANDRQDQFRLPGAPMGLVGQGLVRPCEPRDFEHHHEWLRCQGLPL